MAPANGSIACTDCAPGTMGNYPGEWTLGNYPGGRTLGKGFSLRNEDHKTFSRLDPVIRLKRNKIPHEIPIYPTAYTIRNNLKK